MSHRTDPNARLHVLVTLHFPQEWLDSIAAVDPRIVIEHHPVGEEEDPHTAIPPEVLARAEVMYTSAVLPGPAAAPRLRWVQLDTSGVDHVRGSGLWESDVVITTLGGISPAPLAEWVMMMVLADAHHLPHLIELQRDGTWPDRAYRWEELMPRNLRTSTMTIVGYGRIGRELARMATGFGMQVVGVRRGRAASGELFGERSEEIDAEVVTVDQLSQVLPRTDYLVLTVPLTPETTGMFSDAQFEQCGPGTMLINAARGGVVDEAAMVRALDSGRLRAVSTDVFSEEPLPAGHPFWSDPRILISPHVAGFAPDYAAAVTTLFTENLSRYLADRSLVNVAQRERGY